MKLPIRKIVFTELSNMLFGRRMSSCQEGHGFEMHLDPDAGLVFIRDAREPRETVVIHPSRCEVYLREPEAGEAAAAPTKDQSEEAAPAKPSKGAPQVR